MSMNDEDLLRYSRQIMLPDIEVAGQEKLLAATVLVVGLGGLGCPAALYLAAAGVGHLILVDFDTVDITNLQRQIAHGTEDVGRLKVESARDAIADLNPNTRVTCVAERLTADSVARLVENVDLVVDGSDNFDTRFIVNDACVARRKPLVSAAAIQLEGQAMVYDPAVSDCACYRCLYQDASDAQFNCAENGVAAPVVGIMGTIQAMEALKLIVGSGQTLAGYLLVFDAKTMDWRKLKLPRNPKCKTCGG
ncbi:MAG TPA: molybdopterin-synthase adenylyltransferase MoeB [Pseudomonadales bacterium]|nr:molybdopterin-synthase adenylyltransferase MoeB [Pseudomonadales bacterium]